MKLKINSYYITRNGRTVFPYRRVNSPLVRKALCEGMVYMDGNNSNEHIIIWEMDTGRALHGPSEFDIVAKSGEYSRIPIRWFPIEKKDN